MLVYGVMVTQLFLVQSFKVRVLVDQRKASQFFGRLFLLKKFRDFFLKILREFLGNLTIILRIIFESKN
jgi:hypothetical protein